jgi:hypothetical protein
MKREISEYSRKKRTLQDREGLSAIEDPSRGLQTITVAQ